MTLNNKHIWTNMDKKVIRKSEVTHLVKEVLSDYFSEDDVDEAAEDIAARLSGIFDIYDDGIEDDSEDRLLLRDPEDIPDSEED